MEGDDRRRCVAALRRGLDLGMTHIDTAEMYGSGRVETIVGEAISGRRDEVFLATKVLPSNASYQGTLDACHASLERLGTDRLDLYMLHWSGQHPLEDTFRAFETLREQGKIVRWGVSNFDLDAMKDAIAVAGPGKIQCNQVLYHLDDRAIEAALIPWCVQHDVPVVAYSPFGSGQFPTAGSPGRQALERVAARHGKTAHQVALAFLIRHPNVWAIPKAAAPAHVADNSGAQQLRLSDDDIAAIDAAMPRGNRTRLGWI